MAINTDRNYQQMLSAALAYRKRGIEDLVSNNNVLFNVVRDKGNYRSFDGPEIRHHLQYDKQEAQGFTGYDKLRNSPIELFNDAVFRPVAVAVPISFAGSELRANTGDRLINLMTSYLEAAENAMNDKLEVDMFSNGTADGGRQIAGLGAAVPIVTNTGTYGGINRANVPEWRTSTYDIATAFPDIGVHWDSTTIRPILSRIQGLKTRGTRHADLLIMAQQPFEALEQSMVAQQRIVNETRLGRLGFSSLEFIGSGKRAEAILASGYGTSMPADTVFGLESRSLYLYYRDSLNFDPLFEGDGAKPINQDAIAQFLAWEGQFVLGNPMFSWRAYDSAPL